MMDDAEFQEAVDVHTRICMSPELNASAHGPMVTQR
jgi:hypothetical protein